MRIVQRLLALLCCAIIAVVAGCSSDLPGPERERPKEPEPQAAMQPTTGTLADIQVTGTWGTRPNVEFPIPLAIEEAETATLVTGAGPRLKDGGKALLAIYTQIASSGEVRRDDFSTVPQVYRVSRSTIGEDLYDAILGVRTGSRILHVVYDTVPLVIVVDVLPLHASGDPVTNHATESSDGAKLPTVASKKNGAPVITIPKKSKPPASLTTSILVRGSGAQVLAGETAVLQYEAVRWSKKKVVGSTWDPDKLPVTVKVGADALIEGLDAALTDVTAGSRILVVVPPGLAFGLSEGKWQDETMVYVIDVLAASAPSVDESITDEAAAESADEPDSDSSKNTKNSN